MYGIESNAFLITFNIHVFSRDIKKELHLHNKTAIRYLVWICIPQADPWE